jgi:uncharacterized membrane protein YfcA
MRRHAQLEAFVIYFLLAILSTAIGSLTGMGGGVIIKPVMDFLGGYDVETIGVLSSVTVLSMAVVSIARQMRAKADIPFRTAVPLAVGSMGGGFLGQWLLEAIALASSAGKQVTVVQNIVLAVLIFAVFLYMLNKRKIKGYALQGIPVSLLAGVFLGICSSFLGIGGGPINVALIVYLYGYDTKTATVCSLITILFAQVSKLSTVALTVGFTRFDLEMAPVMVVGAIAGGFIGAALNRRCREKTVERAFNAVQLLVLGIAIVNIVQYWT